MSEPTIHQALSAVMGQVQAVGKTGRNESQGFSFRGIDAVVNAVGPALRDEGVIVVPKVLDRWVETYQTRNGANMKNVSLLVEFTFHGPAKDTIVCSAVGEASDSGDKATSKAHSVAFRTALLQALCIPTDEPDPDASSHERAAAPSVIDGALAARVRKACTTKELRDMFRDRFGCGAAEVPADRADEVEDWLSDLETPTGEETGDE
jgi:hypothetical protein